VLTPKGPLNEREKQLRGSTTDDEAAVANEGDTYAALPLVVGLRSISVECTAEEQEGRASASSTGPAPAISQAAAPLGRPCPAAGLRKACAPL
jgi:hypothetical protein